MAAPKTTLWSMDKHTQAKHEILRRYLEAWFPILISFRGQVRIIDGFAGPGEYANGKIGSPLIALNALLQHPYAGVQQAIANGNIELVFIEQDKKRSSHLRHLLEQQKYSSPLKPNIITGTFVEEMEKRLPTFEQQRDLAIPTFVFIDPFGYSHTPLNYIKRLMNLPMCEVLINFMCEEVNRFLTSNYRTKDRHYDELFGTTEWQKLAQQATDTDNRQKHLHELYRHQLLTAGGARYVRSFRMLNQRNATDYYLFFCTNSLKGLEAMKRAMWKVDESGTFEFSDFSNPYQPLLFKEPNYADLQRQIIQRFKGNTVSIADIEEYVLAETSYINFKKEALKPLEQASPPKIYIVDSPPKRKKGTYSDSTMRIKFL
jgi:three-Cys-motif partner protein